MGNNQSKEEQIRTNKGSKLKKMMLVHSVKALIFKIQMLQMAIIHIKVLS